MYIENRHRYLSFFVSSKFCNSVIKLHFIQQTYYRLLQLTMHVKVLLTYPQNARNIQTMNFPFQYLSEGAAMYFYNGHKRLFHGI